MLDLDPGPERRIAEKVGEGQRPQADREIREGGYSGDHTLPWAAHTYAHANTPEEHTRPHTHTRLMSIAHTNA